MERNVVATVRDWADPQSYVHDLSGTDRRHPTVNGYGPLYGSPELSTDNFPILDPMHNIATTFKAPVRDANTPTTHDDPVVAPSPYWGTQRIWDSKANAHNPMLDSRGRVWYTARIRAPDNPAFCKNGSTHPSAQLFPTEQSDRQLAVYEPKSGKYTFIDTCFATHHLQFAEDANNTLWTSGGNEMVGWLDTKKFDQHRRCGRSAGLGTVRPRHQRQRQARRVDRARTARGPEPGHAPRGRLLCGHAEPSRRLDLGLGRVSLPRRSPALRSAHQTHRDLQRSAARLWCARRRHRSQRRRLGVARQRPSGRVRPSQVQRAAERAQSDRRSLPGRLELLRLPGPGFAGLPQFSVESSYYTWVDQHDTLGLGANVPIATGNLFDGVHALVDGKFVTLRIPYPLGFYAKGLEGRIDDPTQAGRDEACGSQAATARRG